MPIITVSERGQLVIPRQIRERLNLSKGSKLLLEWSAGEKAILLRPVEAGKHRTLRGFLKGTPALEVLEAEHRREMDRDEQLSGQ